MKYIFNNSIKEDIIVLKNGNLMQETIKDLGAKLIFILTDILIVTLSLYLAYLFRGITPLFGENKTTLNIYFNFYPIYIIILSLFLYEGIYTYRYDFWHETRKIFKALILAALLTFAYLAMTKSIEHYSRIVIGASFVFMFLLLPISKLFIKKLLHKIGLWSKEAKIYGNDTFLNCEIYNNSYLGYKKPKDENGFSTVFINSKTISPDRLKALIESEIKHTKEVIFTPILDEYDLTHSQIYELSNTRTNLIVYENRLKSWHRRLIQTIFNYLLALLLLPILLPIIIIIAIAIKLESRGGVFFIHKRVGKGGKTIPVVKFRSMYIDAKDRLESMLKSDQKIREEWESCFKLKDDPRVTKVGKFLRKTSLDELPQIFNVLLGHMNFVGPRPVIQEEIDNYYKDIAEYYFMVKPGITGLWQVSGRSDTDYEFRTRTDKWYVLNWSIWKDIVILIKTIGVVLKRDGAY